MIKSKNGRTWSERTSAEEIGIIKKEMEGLSVSEREALILALKELNDPTYKSMTTPGTSPTRMLDVMSDAEYARPLVSIEQFVRDPYYLGETCSNLYPVLMEDLKEVFRGGYREVVLTGCIELNAIIQGANGSLKTIGERIGRSEDVISASLVDSEAPIGFVTASSGVAKHSGILPVVRMELANGMSQKLTPDHRVMVWRDGYCWVPAGKLIVDDLVVVPRKISTAPDSDLSEAEAKLLAYWCTDGSSSETRSRFDDGNPATSLEVVKLLSEIGFSGERYAISDKCWEVYVHKHKKSGFLTWLREHEGANKTHDVLVPDSVCRAPNAIVAAFINRVWAAEGCVYCNPTVSAPRFSLGMTSERFIRQVQLLLFRFGVLSRIQFTPQFDKRSGKTTESWVLSVSGVGPMRVFLDAFGPVLGKEENCNKIANYCTTKSENTNVDIVPIRRRWLSKEMTSHGIRRKASSLWWRLGMGSAGYMSRQAFERWLGDFGLSELGQRLSVMFPSDVSFEKVVSIETAGECEVGDICDVVDLKNFVSNGICSHNSVGYGKTFLGSIILCRTLYELSCMRDIHRTVGLSPGSDVSLVGISVNEQLAIRVVYENIATKIAQSPYFRDNFPFQDTKKELRFPNNVIVAALSTTDTAALGRNVLSAILDEGNFYEGIVRGKAAQAKFGDKDKARVLYDQLVRRMKSRFMRGGKMPGKMIIVSSKRTKDDFTAKRIAESINDPEVYVIDYATWDVKPEAFGAERFQVLVGNETMPSKILLPDEVASAREVVEHSGDESLMVVDVPEEYRSDFENDLDGSIRDSAGRSTVSVSPYIQQRDRIERCIDPGRQHPFDVDEWDQSKPGTFAWSRLASREMTRDGAELFEAWKPLFYPQMPRHVHIDLSVNTDATGICMGCIIGYTLIERINLQTQEKYSESSPIIWVDFMLRIIPPMGGEIDHGEVRGLVYQLQSHGFHISLLTMDQAQSASTKQMFRKKGINVEDLSVDRPIAAYDTLKSAIYEKRINMYRYDPILTELRTLQKDHIKQKVDHVRGGKKDVSDALAGITFSLTMNSSPAPMMPLKGISQSNDPEVERDRASVEDYMPPFILGL